MKKLLLSIIICLAAASLSAQNAHLLRHSNQYRMEMRTLMENRDGEIIMNCAAFDDNGMDVGMFLFKVSPQGVLLDSILFSDNDILNIMMQRNPFGNDNFMVDIERDRDNPSTSLRIIYFTDDLEITNEITVPIADTTTVMHSLYFDCYNDIILSYCKRWGSETHIARIGLDGTVKDNEILPGVIFSSSQAKMIDIYRKSPLEYFLWGQVNNDSVYGSVMKTFITDSSFNLIGSNRFFNLDSLYYTGGYKDQFMYVDNGTYLFSSSYWIPIHGIWGVHLSEFKKEQNLIKRLEFPNEEGIQSYGKNPIRILKSKRDGIYFTYLDNVDQQIIVVKLDDYLNIEWTRYCQIQTGIGYFDGDDAIALDNGGVAVGGDDYYDTIWGVYLCIFTEDGLTTPEMEAFVKPFCIYPNPATDFINIAISPDTKCEKIELYNLSGKLLQSLNGVETTQQLDTHNLTPGNYILNLMLDNGKSYSEKIIVE